MSWLLTIASNVCLAALLASAAWFTQRRLRSYGVARVLWVLVLVKLVTPPLVSVPIGVSLGTWACTLGACGCGQHAQQQAIVRSVLPAVLLAGWSVGAAVMSWTAWRRWSHFQRLLTHARPAPPEWQQLARGLSAGLSLRRVPEILALPGRLPPMVVAGWRRPRVLLPASLLDQLGEAQRAPLLLHELVHVHRGDHLVRVLELIVSVAFWWLPGVRSIGRQLRACEETCCDAAVVTRLPQARRDYALLLLDVLDFADPLPRQVVPQATAMSPTHDLEQRLRGILGGTPGPRRAWPVAVATIVGACALLPCGMQYEVGRNAPPTSLSLPLSSPMLAIEGCEGGSPLPARAPDLLGLEMAAFCCPR